jgi:basic membrane protein A
MKRGYAVFALLALAGLTLAACGGAATTAAPQATSVPEEPTAVPPTAVPPTEAPPPAPECMYKLGLVTDVGRIDDQSFNQSSYEGMVLAAERLGLSTDCYSFIETTDAADYAPNIEAFVNEGAQIIVTVGFAIGAATREAARSNPDVIFIGVDQSQVDENFAPDPIDNVAGLLFHEDVSGFLAGALAGLLTETNVIGGVYGCTFIPPVVRFEMGYTNGARHVNPDVEVKNAYHPGDLSVCFTDPAFGSDTAATLIAEGADIVFAAAGSTGNGALVGACNAGVRVIGVDTDQFLTVPEAQACILSSATKDLTNGVADLIASVADGTFTGGEHFGGAVLAPFHNFENVIPQEVKDQLAALAEQLAAGEINPCVAYEGAPYAAGAFCVPVTPIDG